MLYYILTSSHRSPRCSLHQSFTSDWCSDPVQFPGQSMKKPLAGCVRAPVGGTLQRLCAECTGSTQAEGCWDTFVSGCRCFYTCFKYYWNKNRRLISPASLSCKKIEKQFGGSPRIPLFLLYYFIKTLLCSVLYEVATHASSDRVQACVSPDVLHESHLLVYITPH